MDIAAWLRSLGLERYEPVFRDNEIDAAVLPELTDEHLKELGLPLGPRLKLLKGVAALHAPAGADRAAEGEAPSSPTVAAPEAERRHLTVLFCDLVGSTELAGRLDPEDLRDVIRAYQDACAGAIVRFEGHVAKYMGDGVLAYFGYPRAHEGEAERAVCAGLQAVRAVGALTPCAGPPLQARVGIATGMVVVGDLVGEGAAQEEAVVGETPNLAARLQALAEPGSVVVGPTTRRLLGGLFDYADLGVHRLKGFAAPVRAWRVLGSGRAEGRFEARQAAGLTPLVGREHELGLLLDRWRQAAEGDGQVVLLGGEPGVGKSRLVRALREQLGEHSLTPLSHFCSPYHQGSALHPVIGLLERGAGLARDDPPERQLDKLEALLALATDDVPAVAPLLADLLGIPTGGRYPPLALSPQRRKERTLAALLTQLEGLAARQPVLALYEDVHWSDPTTLELLDQIVDRVPGSRVLVLITFRPEFRPPWIGFAHVSLLTLNRLNKRQVAAMAERVAGGKALPPEVLEQIAAKTDGVPLFVEELTKTVLEAGLLQEEGDRYTLAGPLPALAIPATLYDSLMARLDRLAPVREVAQVGAVIGREFGHELLTAVMPLHGEELAHALTELVDSELVFRRGTAPHATYTFKHALVQDAAYASLLRGKRQQLHARIAAVLEEQFLEVAEAQPELLARHFAEAGLGRQAIAYLQKAGDRAAERSAYAEAISHLSRGLELLQVLPDDPERTLQELDLRIALGSAFMATRGYAGAEVEATYLRARELCRQAGETSRLFPVLHGLYRFHHVRGELQAAREAGEQLLSLAEGLKDPALFVEAHRALGVPLFWLGDVPRFHLWDRPRGGLPVLLGFGPVATRPTSASLGPEPRGTRPSPGPGPPAESRPGPRLGGLAATVPPRGAAGARARRGCRDTLRRARVPALDVHGHHPAGLGLRPGGPRGGGDRPDAPGLGRPAGDGCRALAAFFPSPAGRGVRQAGKAGGGARRARRSPGYSVEERRARPRGGAAPSPGRAAARGRDGGPVAGRALLPQGGRGRASAEGQVARTPRRNIPGASLRRSRPTHRGPRRARPGPRPIHRGLRHRGPERREDTPRAIRVDIGHVSGQAPSNGLKTERSPPLAHLRWIATLHFPIHGRLPLRKGFRRGWHSGLGCCHPFGLNDHRSLASMRSAGRLPIIFSGSWPWESDGLRRPRSDRSCHPQRLPSQLVEAFQGRIDLIRPKPSIDLPENALAPPSSARLTPPHGRSRHGSAGPRGSVPACSRPRPRRR